MLLVLANVMAMLDRPVVPPRGGSGARLALATRQAPVAAPMASAHQPQKGIFGNAEARQAAREQQRQQQTPPPTAPFSSANTQALLKKQPHGSAEARWQARLGYTEAPAQQPVASVQFMITQAMRIQLAKLGYNSDEIERLDPQHAATILNSQRSAEILGKPASGSGTIHTQSVGTTYRSQPTRRQRHAGVPSPAASTPRGGPPMQTGQTAYDAQLSSTREAQLAAGAAHGRQPRYTAPVPPAATAAGVAAVVAADGSVLGARIYQPPPQTSRNALERRQAREGFFAGYPPQQPPQQQQPPQPPQQQHQPPQQPLGIAAQTVALRHTPQPPRDAYPHELALAAEKDKLFKERVAAAEARATAATAEARASAAAAEARAAGAAAEARAVVAVSEARAAAAAAEARASAATAAAEARAAAAAAEERAAAAEERAAAAEGRADKVEKSAKEAAEEAGGRASEAMPAWLVKLAGGEIDALAESHVVAAVSEAAVAARQTPKSNSVEASVKKAWLASLDVGLWSKAALKLSEAASEAAEMAELDAMCGSGDGVSCRILSEQETDAAKRATLSQLNVASWSAAAGVLSVAASDATAVSAAALEALEAFGFINHLTNEGKRPTADGDDDSYEDYRRRLEDQW